MLFDVVSYINSLCRNLAYSSKKILEWLKIDEGNLTSSFGGLWATKNKNAGEIVCLLDAIDKHAKVTEGLGSPRPYVNLLIGIWHEEQLQSEVSLG
jgi:hypothetical protein